MLQFERTCRCCMVEMETEAELYDFSSEIAIEADQFVAIISVFNAVTSIKILKADEDYSKICPDCLQELKNAYVFRMKTLQNDRKFRQELIKKRRVTGSTSKSNFIGADNPDDDMIIKQEDNNENEYIEYIDEEYLDPVYLNEGVAAGEATTITLADDAFDPDDDEYMEEEEEEEYEDSESVSMPRKSVSIIKGPLVKRSKVSFKPEGDDNNQLFYCGFCPKTFDRSNYYRRHFRRVHMDEEMENCRQILQSENRLSEIKDLQIHSCEFCGKIDLIKASHLEHMSSHEGQGLYKCKKCDVGFPNKEELKQHIAEHPELRKFVCDICGNSFKNRYALMLHNRSHTGEKPFKCPICDRGFSMASNMQKHIDSHSDARPYACEVCGQFCKTPRSLKFHIICFHKTEMKIKCPDCDKSFVNKSYLKMHQQYHTGEKNFTCTICESKYYKSSHLKRHIQHVHFKLRLLKCEFCSSDFVRKETYRTHVLNHHKNVPQDQLDAVLEKIKNFKPPALDVDQFTLEKQKYIKTDPEGAQIVEVSEIVEEDEEAVFSIEQENEYQDMEQDEIEEDDDQE